MQKLVRFSFTKKAYLPNVYGTWLPAKYIQMRLKDTKHNLVFYHCSTCGLAEDLANGVEGAQPKSACGSVSALVSILQINLRIKCAVLKAAGQTRVGVHRSWYS